MLTLIIFLLVLGILVFVHEAGHYLTAKLFKVKAEEFGFGLPPRLCGWKKVNGKRKFFWGNKATEKIESEDTVWSLNWLLLGGFVKIKGEDGENKDPDSFASQKPWKRALILVAGVVMNWILAMVLLSIVFLMGAPQVIDSQTNFSAKNIQIQVWQVVPSSPAVVAGFKSGDIIEQIDQQKFSTIEQIQTYIATKKDQAVKVSVERFGTPLELTLKPEFNQEVKAVKMGLSLVQSGIVSYPWYESIWLGIKTTFTLTVTILVTFYSIIKNLFIGVPTGVEVLGPVGIAVMTGQVARLGLVHLLQFAALLSINLAIINFLPIPALDGGRLLFILIEKIRRKPVSQKVESMIHAIGFLLLIGLILLITGRDIFNFKNLAQGIFH